MTQEPAPNQKRPNAGFVPDELAVDLEHLNRVTGMLDTLGVAWAGEGQSEELGLALLSLSGLDKSVASLPAKDLEAAEEFLHRVKEQQRSGS